MLVLLDLCLPISFNNAWLEAGLLKRNEHNMLLRRHHRNGRHLGADTVSEVFMPNVCAISRYTFADLDADWLLDCVVRNMSYKAVVAQFVMAAET